MHILKKPDLSDPKMRAKLAKGMGHNYYGEPAWPNDLLYIFPVVILGTIACVVGLAVLDPAMLADHRPRNEPEPNWLKTHPGPIRHQNLKGPRRAKGARAMGGL